MENNDRPCTTVVTVLWIAFVIYYSIDNDISKDMILPIFAVGFILGIIGNVIDEFIVKKQK